MHSQNWRPWVPSVLSHKRWEMLLKRKVGFVSFTHLYISGDIGAVQIEHEMSSFLNSNSMLWLLKRLILWNVTPFRLPKLRPLHPGRISDDGQTSTHCLRGGLIVGTCINGIIPLLYDDMMLMIQVSAPQLWCDEPFNPCCKLVYYMKNKVDIINSSKVIAMVSKSCVSAGLLFNPPPP